jgi:hypothetical protein
MKISEEVKNKWAALWLTGDYEEIIAGLPNKRRVSKETLRRSFKAGDYKSMHLLKAVEKFYLEREANLPK